MRSRTATIVVWLVFFAGAAAIVAHARFTADLSAFLPTDPTPEQSLLIEQLRDGPASHLILVAIAGRGVVAEATLARVSRAMTATLRGDANFLSVNNGQVANAAGDRAFLFDHRYLLSDQVTAGRFTAAGLHGALADSLDLLTSSAGTMLQPLIARDPTAELVHLVDGLTAGRDLPTVDGVWVAHDSGSHALIVAETRAAGSDIDGQEAAIEALRAAFASASAGDAPAPQLVLSGVPVFAVDARTTIERESKHLSAIGLVLVAALLGFVYRSPRALVLGLLPMLTGATAGLAVVALAFGMIHGVALGFGVTLIGEAVDYAIYLFVQRPHVEAGARPPPGRFWRTIALGVGTSAIGFAALVFSGFQGLAQIGVLSIVGLVVAAAVTRWVLPAMLPANFAVRPMPRLGTALQRATRAAPRGRPAVALVAVAAVVVLVAHRDALWSRELGSLSPMSQSVQDTDAKLRSELGAPDVRDIVVVGAQDREAALAGSEAVGAILAPLIAAGTLAGAESPARYLPSLATQRRRQAALPDDATLRRDFATALDGLPFAKTGFDGFFADVARERASPLLDDRDLATTSLAPALRALLSSRAVPGGPDRWTAVIALRSFPDVEVPRAALAERLARLDATGGTRVRLIDIRNETQRIYSSYLSEAITMAGAGALAIVALLAVALRDAVRLARIVVPLALAVVLVAAAHVAWGGPLNLFHLVGLLLIVGVGSNYALFFDRRCAAVEPDDYDRQVLTSLVVANLTAVVGFGVLGLSSLPVLESIGTTVAPGALVALLLAAVAAKPVSGREAS